MNLTCLIRPTGRADRSDDRSHDPTVGPTGRTDRSGRPVGPTVGSCKRRITHTSQYGALCCLTCFEWTREFCQSCSFRRRPDRLNCSGIVYRPEAGAACYVRYRSIYYIRVFEVRDSIADNYFYRATMFGWHPKSRYRLLPIQHVHRRYCMVNVSYRFLKLFH